MGIPITHPIDPYASVVQAVNRKYPLLASVPLRLVKGSPDLPFQSETYMPWDDQNPYRGDVTVQMRKANPRNPQEMQDLLTTEAMHYLGAQGPDGKPINPDWWKLKQAFRGALTPKDMELAQQHWKDEQNDGENRSFDDFMNHSYLDMFMRGYMFPQSQGQEWVDRQGHWPPEQAKILDQMQQMLNTGH